MKSLAQDSWMIAAVVLLAAFAIGLWGGQEAVFALQAHESPAQRIVRMEAEGDALHCQETLLWDERTFSAILAEESEFSSKQIGQFMKTYRVNANNFSVEFLRDRKSTLLRCDVHGTFSGNWYDFHWFLNPLGLDFLDSPFERAEKALSWKGRINGISTSIVLEFPFSISNCHAHVWPK
jgi:hypothetical protein